MKGLFVVPLLLSSGMLFAQNNVYTLNLDVPEKKIEVGHLKLGGANPKGERMDVNSYYMSVDDKPVIPVMGEFHYCRYPAEQCGIDT